MRYSWAQVIDRAVMKKANTLWVVAVIDRIVAPLLFIIANFTGISPNMVTAIGMLLTIPAAYAFATGHFIWGIVLQQSVLIADAIDGKLARLTGRTSPFGRLYDNLVDRMRSIIPMLGLIYFLFSQTGDVLFVFWGLFYLVWDLLVIYMYEQSYAMNENRRLVEVVERQGSLISRMRAALMRRRLTLLYSDIETEVVVFILGPVLSFWLGYSAVLYAMMVGTGLLVLIYLIFFALQFKIAWSNNKSS